MDKIKLDTSIQFPFFKINELVTYSEVKKPSGISYILLVLINESKDRNANLSNVLENFGVPKNLQYIFADELSKLIRQSILDCDGFHKNEFDNYSIGYFRFTEKGKKIFAEESIPTGVNKEAKIPVFYNIAKNELSLSIDNSLEPKPLMDCALTPELFASFKCNKDVESYLNLNKGKNGIKIKREEIITNVETIGEFENWTAKYDCEIEITQNDLSIDFEDDVLQKFAEKYYSGDFFTASIMYKNKFKFQSKYSEHVSLSSFDSEMINSLFVPKELEDTLKQKSKLLFTKGNYQTNSSFLCTDANALNKYNSLIEFIQVDVHDSIYGYIPATFDFDNERFGQITLPLVLKLKITNNDFKSVVRDFLLTKAKYSEDNFRTLVKLTDITKDYALADELMNGYMLNNNETNLVNLNEMKPIAVMNPSILAIHKELTKSNCLAYVSGATETNLETVLKITSPICKYLNLSNEELLKLIFDEKKVFKSIVEMFELLLKYGFSKESISMYLNPVPDVLKTRNANHKLLVDIINFDERLKTLKEITNISSYKTYSFEEERLDRNLFKKEYSTAYSLYKNIQFFKASNSELFKEYDGLMGVFGLINDHINMIEDALKNPKNIKHELIEKKIILGDYQFVFINLSTKLEMLLKNKYKLEGKLSDMLSDARRNGIIRKEIISDLHDFRENRNAFVHPDDRKASFNADDLRRWAKEIFDLEEDTDESTSNS